MMTKAEFMEGTPFCIKGVEGIFQYDNLKTNKLFHIREQTEYIIDGVRRYQFNQIEEIDENFVIYSEYQGGNKFINKSFFFKNCFTKPEENEEQHIK